MPNTNFQAIHQMDGVINSFVKQATGRDAVQNIDMEHITVAQNHYYEDVDISGRVVSFNAGAEGIPLEKCLVQIEPVQEGTGDPSPDNVRPISGWTGAKVTVNEDALDITFPSEAGTVYGGTLDVTNGTLTVNRACSNLVDYLARISNNGERNGNQLIAVSFTGKNPGEKNFISNIFVNGTSAVDKFTMHGRVTSAAVEFELPFTYLGVTADEPVETRLAAARQWFADNTTQLCYELATPITYQLTPQEVSTLLGQNNIWADTGDIEVKFKNIKEFF